MNYLLDTNIALMYLRDAPITQEIDTRFAPFEAQNSCCAGIFFL